MFGQIKETKQREELDLLHSVAAGKRHFSLLDRRGETRNRCCAWSITGHAARLLPKDCEVAKSSK
jgi:hypothetical protein